jgi:DNA (cytosine-5)-methyltransferase 1
MIDAAALAAEHLGNGADDMIGWPRDPSERADFYHRVRVFPSDLADWRKSLVRQVLEVGTSAQALSHASPSDEAKAHIDDGISRIREIARILALVHRSPELGRVVTAGNRDARRVWSRIGPWSELGLKPASTNRMDPISADLIPVNLRRSLNMNLAAHGETVCLPDRPLCEACEVRKLCNSFRQTTVAAAEKVDSPTVVDLFCGAGGLSHGFSRSGFRTIAAIDSDPLALRTYRVNHAHVPDDAVLLRDITSLKAGELRRRVGLRVNVLLAAPPCQGFSHAGFRSKPSRTGYKVTSDSRNYLFEQVITAATELTPELLLMENVPGMQSARRDDLSFLEIAATKLQKIGNFRTAIWRLNAAAFGVPQDRIRYFLVASRLGTLPPAPAEDYQDIHRAGFDPDALPPVTLNEAVFDLPERAAGAGTAVDRFDRTGSDSSRHRRYLLKFGLLSQGRLVYNHSVRYHNERDLELYGLLRPGEDSVHAVERHGRRDLMRYRNDVFDDKYYRLRPDRPCKTIVSHLAKDGNGYIHPHQPRSITVREAARIQSFPDDYVFCGSPSDQWIQVGNAVPPVLAQAIATTFKHVLLENCSTPRTRGRRG